MGDVIGLSNQASGGRRQPGSPEIHNATERCARRASLAVLVAGVVVVSPRAHVGDDESGALLVPIEQERPVGAGLAGKVVVAGE